MDRVQMQERGEQVNKCDGLEKLKDPKENYLADDILKLRSLRIIKLQLETRKGEHTMEIIGSGNIP